jgi:predicted molibdopterin-dependent oxidoreductase YjgC
VPGIKKLVPEELMEISPADAKTLQINDGDMVKVSSRRGKINVRAKVTERSRKGNVFMTFHFPEALSNFLTSEHRDPVTGTPEYKVCAVKIEK